jgi:DNA-binding transcriptional ArsR family regulator
MLPDLAGALGISLADLRAAAGQSGQLSEPVTALATVGPFYARSLPFQDLGWERFEDVCADILQHVYPNSHVSRYGGQGERQDGIDLLADEPRVATAQCKRRKRFGPQQVRDAINAVAEPAPRNYLFLSRQTATADARREIAKHPTWVLWDGEDMSRYVRGEMDRECALRFVETHFPNSRQTFLGRETPSPWATTAEFYAPTSGVRIFTQDWTLVGRAQQLDELCGSIHIGREPITLLMGRGGIGKTRLLRSVADTFEPSMWVRFLPATAIPTPADYELIPPHGRILIVIDDAHDRPDIGLVIVRIRTMNPEARLLIATRPYGRAAIDDDLLRAGITLRDGQIVVLDDLGVDDAIELALEALGDEQAGAAERLAALTRDCPLATTAGGFLIRAGQMQPGELEQDDTLRAILRRFVDALAKDPAQPEPELRRAVLDALSILQPFHSGNPAFQEAISGLAGVPFDRISHHLRSLEGAGLVIRREDSLRIAPDLLGDVILADACFDRRTGVDSGYLRRVMQCASGDPLINAFVNVSRVDWQVGHAISAFSDPVWATLRQALKEREIGVYLHVISLLGRIAPFQPSRTAELVRWIVEHPIADDLSEPSNVYFRSTWKHVLEAIPAVLRAAAYTTDGLSAVASVLWELAQHDDRPLHQFPNHPLRVLQELAEYSPYKTSEYYFTLVELAGRWAGVGYKWSSLKIVEKLVATEGESQRFHENTLYLGSFRLNQDFVGPVRRRAIELAIAEIRSGDPRRGVAGAKFARKALAYPAGAYGRNLDDNERESWGPDFVLTIDALRDCLMTEALDPVVSVSIFDAVFWLSEFGLGGVRTAAQAAVDAMPDGAEYEIALLLYDGWGHLVRNRELSFEEHQQDVQRRLVRVAKLLVAALVDDAAIVSLIEDRLRLVKTALRRDLPTHVPLLEVLVAERASLAQVAMDRVADDADSPLVALVPQLLRLISFYQTGELMGLVRRLLEHSVDEVRTQAAIGLATRYRGDGSLLAGEAALLERFAVDESVTVRLAVQQTAFALADTDISVGARLLTRIPFADSPKVADDLFMYLGWDDNKLTWDVLNAEQRAAIFAQLRSMDDIGSPSIEEFLDQRSGEDPRAVLELMRGRVEDAEGGRDSKSFHPMPYAWHRPLVLRQHPEFLTILRELLAWLGDGSSWRRRMHGQQIFMAAVGTFDEPVFSLLLETLRTGGEAASGAVSIAISSGSPTLVFDDVKFVCDIVDVAARLGPVSLQKIRGALHSSAVTGTRWGTPGQPYAEDIRLRDECAVIAAQLPIGSPGAQFYLDLSEAGERSVAAELKDDRPDDGRDW